MDDAQEVKEKKSWDRIQKFCRSFEKENANDFERYLSESWFSNTLAWLLNPKESHGLGVKFSNEFLALIAQKRTEGCSPWHTDKTHDYLRRNTMLKWRRSTGKGQSPIGLSLKNAFPVTEFYLSKDPTVQKPKGQRIPSYVDVLFLDMDLKDGVTVTVENKLFTTNHPEQLGYYYKSIEGKFSAATIREYVYLTLLGDAPIQWQKKEGERPEKLNPWVCLSWLDDLRSILKKLVGEDNSNADLSKLLKILDWLRRCHPQDAPADDLPVFRKKLLEHSTDCLLEELDRLGGDKRGRWELKTYKQKMNNTLVHSSYSARELHVNLLPNLTVTITGRNSAGGLFEKVIVPFGCNADQMYNLLDIAARDIYIQFFRDASLYLDARRRKKVRSEIKLRHESFFNFVCSYATALRLLLTFTSLRRGDLNKE